MTEPIYTVLSDRIRPVSRLCFGSLTVGPLQANLGIERGSDVIAYAFDRGINFIDTAQYYANYDIIKAALDKCRRPENVVISTKTYAYSTEGARDAVDEAMSKLGRDFIDIFMLHEQESIHTLHGHMDALKYLLEMRDKGKIGAVGVSTHHVACVKGVIELYEKENIKLDVIHPLYNKEGIGIADGSAQEMEAALTEAKQKLGIGVFGMKALGGGHLCSRASEAFDFVLSKPFIDAIAVGMQSEDEVDANIGYFSLHHFTPDAVKALEKKKRTLHIEEYCEGCGSCVKRCTQKALSLIEVTDEQSPAEGDFSADFMREENLTSDKSAEKHYIASVDTDKCVLCAYCTKVCPVFALKVF